MTDASQRAARALSIERVLTHRGRHHKRSIRPHVNPHTTRIEVKRYLSGPSANSAPVLRHPFRWPTTSSFRSRILPVFDAATATLPTRHITRGDASAARSAHAHGRLCMLLLAAARGITPSRSRRKTRRPPRVRSSASRSIRRTMPLPELAAHRFDPSDGLDIDEVAMLAVANNPDLKLSRDDLGIARAQAYSAGLAARSAIERVERLSGRGRHHARVQLWPEHRRHGDRAA